MRSTRAHRYRAPVAATLAATLVAAVACQERIPTALDDSRLPDEPLTVEVQLTWSDFGSNFQVLGGYGTAAVLPTPLVALDAGVFEARTLVRFAPYPTAVQVLDTTGVTRVDSTLTFISGRVVLTVDSLSSSPGPATLELGALQEVWDARTATWTSAVDSVADQRAWSNAGAGPVTAMATAVWDPAGSDSVFFDLDSAAVQTWIDGADLSRGARVDAMTDGARLEVTGGALLVDIRPGSNPDTVLLDTIAVLERTFVYDPPPGVPLGIRVGGAPAWRTVMQVSIPTLTGPPELCAAVGCPYSLESGHISYGALVLTGRVPPPGYEPADSLLLDVRPVLSPPSLPKSPLGQSQTDGFGAMVAPELFGAMAGTTIEIPITSFMRTLLGPPDGAGRPPPTTLALISAPEPASFSLASFFGPAEPGEPMLSLILTVGTPQVLP